LNRSIFEKFIVTADGMNTQDKVFQLSPEASTWLFAISFWDEVNRVHGTIFAAYDFAEAHPSVLHAMAVMLSAIVQRAGQNTAPTFKFIADYDANNQPHWMTIEKTQLLSELGLLRDFCQTAADAQQALMIGL
jgi:hypothetical protein